MERGECLYGRGLRKDLGEDLLNIRGLRRGLIEH